ncbi:MAG: diaminopimelate epimerase [Terriglobales bacterium]
MAIPFVKASACGNDFLIVEGADPHANLADLSRRMCERMTGIGADGVEWLFADAGADTCARLFNADGSEAEISGNGTRCVAAYLCSKDHREKIVVRTGAGMKTCTLASRDDNRYEFEIAMGEPRIGEELSVALASGRRVKGVQISMGNPHFVSIVEEFPVMWQEEASEIGHQPQFMNGINVEFVVVENTNNIAVKFFERGVGETRSSGTGSCAAAVAAISASKAESPVRVHTPGGTQSVRWEQEVFLRGPAQIICSGVFFA